MPPLLPPEDPLAESPLASADLAADAPAVPCALEELPDEDLCFPPIPPFLV